MATPAAHEHYSGPKLPPLDAASSLSSSTMQKFFSPIEATNPDSHFSLSITPSSFLLVRPNSIAHYYNHSLAFIVHSPTAPLQNKTLSKG